MLHSIAKPIRYVFYRILSWKLRDAGENAPMLVAGMCTALLLWFNAMSLMMLGNALLHRESLLPRLPGTRFEQYAVAALLLFAFARVESKLWVENGKLEKLVAEFECMNKGAAAVRNVSFWGYVVVSILLPIVLAVYWRRSVS